MIAAEAMLRDGQTDRAANLLTEIGPAARATSITDRLHRRYVGALLDSAPRPGPGRAAPGPRRAGGPGRLPVPIGSLDLQTASAVHGRHLAELGIAVALQGGDPAAVFAAAEHARAVSTRMPAVRPAADARTAELMAELRQVAEAARPGPAPEAQEALGRRRRELERTIASRRWGLSGTGDVRPVAELGEVQERTADPGRRWRSCRRRRDSARTSDRCARTRLVILGSLAEVVEPIRRVRADLDVLAQPLLPAGLRAAAHRSLARSAGLLDERLVRPLGIDSALVVISTGVLGQVPWGQLPSLRGVPVSVASAATAWLAAARAGRSRRRAVVAVAGPDLPRAEEEAAGVVAAWHGGGSTPGTEPCRRPSPGRWRARACCTSPRTGAPAQDPLLLPATGGRSAVRARTHQSARTPDHVVLSACELGLTTVRPGDEALGLASVLLRLGTKSVIAGVARVGDDVAAETMLEYHQRLARGMDAASALAETTADRVAPFVCFGATWRAGVTGANRRLAAAGFGADPHARVP